MPINGATKSTLVTQGVRKLISIRDLRKVFKVADGEVAALDSLSLDVEPGEFFVIIGASGSGKTTLLRAVAGLEAALAQNRALPDGSAGGPWSYIAWTASGALEMSQEVQRIRA